MSFETIESSFSKWDLKGHSVIFVVLASMSLVTLVVPALANNALPKQQVYGWILLALAFVIAVVVLVLIGRYGFADVLE